MNAKTDNTISKRVEACCREFADRVALFESGQAPVSYSSLWLSILSFAQTLKARGVKPEDRVTIHIRDPIPFLILKLAVLRLGAFPVSVPIERARKDPELAINWLLIAQQESTRSPGEIVFSNAWIRPPDTYVPIQAESRLVHSTSGTTGQPKLRIESEQSVMERVESLALWRPAPDGPVYIGYNVATLIGFKSFLMTLFSGQPQMFYQSSAEETLAACIRNRVAHAYLPPVKFRELAEAAEASNAAMPDLRRVNIGGGAIAPEFAARAEKMLGCDIHSEYGSTETDSVASFRPGEAKGRAGIAGRIFSHLDFRFSAFRAQASSGSPLDGELLIRIPERIRVFDFPGETPLKDADGWVATGDIGHLDEDGMLVLAGRKSEFLNLGGNKRAPAAFELLARSFDGILDVAAFRVQTRTGIDELGLAIVAGDAFDLDDFDAFLTRKLSGICRFNVHVLDEIPLTAAGKIDRLLLGRKFGNADEPDTGS